MISRRDPFHPDSQVPAPRIVLNDNEATEMTYTQYAMGTRKRRRSRSRTQDDGSAASEDDGDLHPMWKVCPKADNEPVKICKLSGNSSSFAAVCGWTSQLPLKFYQLGDSTVLTPMVDGRGNVLSVATEMKDRGISLKEMEGFIGFREKMISCPVYVQVIAKRKVDVFVLKGKLCIIPLVVVADATGYCVVCSFNEGLKTLYEAVSVGDFLLITRCQPQKPKKTLHQGLFSDDLFLDLELKIQYHSVRSHYIRKFSALKAGEFKMHEKLFNGNCQIKTPSDLEKSFKLLQTNLPWISESSKDYYDIIGVVAFVGRIERFRQWGEPFEVECLVDGNLTKQENIRYHPYRWIYIIDKTSKLIPVKLFVYNSTIITQKFLVPGAIVIISHCQTEGTPYSGKFVITSYFSEIYVGANIEKYYMLHPASFRIKTGDLLMRDNYISVVSRKDVVWRIGGTHNTKILSPKDFIKFCNEMFAKSRSLIDLQPPFSRRESRRLYVEGEVLRVLIVENEDAPKIHYLNQQYSSEKEKKRNKQYTVIENFECFQFYNNFSWYSFVRKAPPFNTDALNESKCRDIIKKIVGTYTELCRPLLMPADMDSENKLPPLADLEKMEVPYFMVDIVNKTTSQWYSCIWKSTEYKTEEMTKKLEDAKGKEIVGLVEVFCIEKGYDLEVHLQDFVVKE